MRHAEKKNARGKSSCGAHTRGKQAGGSVATKLANARLPDWIRGAMGAYASVYIYTRPFLLVSFLKKERSGGPGNWHNIEPCGRARSLR